MICKDNISHPVDFKKNTGNFLLKPEWTSLDLTSPYYDSKLKKYFICVPTVYEKPTKENLNQILEEAKRPAIENLINVYGKTASLNDIENLIKIANSIEWFVPDRPAPKCRTDGKVSSLFGTKVLVSVDSNLIDQLPSKVLEPIILPLAFKEINLISSELKNNINNVCEKIDNFYREGNKLKLNINLNKESKRLRNFVSVLENLLIANGFSLRQDQSDLIIIGLNEDLKIIYVLVDNGNSFANMQISFKNFLKTKPVSNDRTINYLLKLDQLIDLGSKKSNISLVDFLKDFTIRPPKLNISLNDINPNSSIEEIIEKSNKKSIKNEDEKQEEDRILNSVQLKTSINVNNKNKTEFVGDVVLSVDNFDSILQKVNSLEDVYEEVLNKVSLPSIISMALKCFPIPKPCVLIRSFLKSLNINQLLPMLIEKAGIDLLKIPELDSIFRFGIKECLGNLSFEEQLNIFNLISVKSNLTINNIDDLIAVPLENIFDVFSGKNLLQKLVEENLKIDFVEASSQDLCAKILIKSGSGEFGFDFNIDIDIQIPEIPKFEIPTITLNDLLPTTDIMASISIQIEAGIIDALVTSLVGMVKNIIKGIIESCGDISDKNFGTININDLLAKSVNVNINAEAFINIQSKLLSNFINIVDNVENLVGNFSKFLDDLSALLSPAEISNLFLGEINDEVLEIINCIVENKYQKLIPIFNNPSKIEDVFYSFGKLIDKKILVQQIALRNEVFGDVKDFCAPENNEGRKKLLENKGLTPEQIDEQVALSNKRRADRLNNLLDLLNKNDILKDAIPPLFCNNENSNGLLPRDHPSFEHMMNKTIDTIYDGVHISFNNEISAFPVALKESTSKQVLKNIPRKQLYVDQSGNSHEIENPEFRRLISQGVSVDDPQNLNGAPVSVWEDQSFSNNFIANGLKNNLENLEFDSRLYSLNESTGKISLIIPNNMESKTLNNSISNKPKELISLEEKIQLIPITENKIEYNLTTNAAQSVDQYSIKILEKNSNNSDTEIFKISKINSLDKSIDDFIKNNNFKTMNQTSLPQSYFAMFVNKIWKDGSEIYENGQKINKPNYAHGVGAINNLHTLDTTFINEIKNSIYKNIFTDLFAAMARQTAKSPLFDSKILSLINFAPPIENIDCQPHLLDLQKIKNKMKNDFNNMKCSEQLTPSTDGLGNASLNSLEQSGVSGAVETFIKLFTLELILRSIFVFSEFKISNIDEVDDIVISYFVDLINKNIIKMSNDSNDLNFKNEFNEQVIKTFNNKIEKRELIGNKTIDFNVALNALIKEQINLVINKITSLIGASGDININKILVEEWIPLFDVANGDLRLSRDAAGNLINLKKGAGLLSLRKDYDSIFNLQNGNLILECYIRIEDKQNTSVVQTNRIGDGLYGIANINDFDNFVKNTLKNLESQTNKKIKFHEEFKKISYGLRLVYVLPTSESDFIETIPGIPVTRLLNNNTITSNIFTTDSNKKTSDSSKLNKCFKIFEGNNVTVDGNFKDLSLPQKQRMINSFPLVSVELAENNLETFTTNDSFAKKWKERAPRLRDLLINSQEYKFLFDFCFPIKRMLSLLMIYNITYLSNIKKLKTLFDGTKTSLKIVFQSLLNSGNYTYNDHYISNMGGSAGLATTSNNNENTEPQVPGMSLAAIAARTPLLLLKGMVELTDSNIGRARQIVDLAKENDSNVPMILASLGQLPMNIFPPIPFGPGIGPPITPLGFLYLALDLDSVFDSAKGKNIKKQELASQGLNFNQNNTCEDK